VTGFLERNTGAFMAELWKLLLSAQENFKLVGGKPVKGMPSELLKEKEEEIKKMNDEIQERSKRIAEEQEAQRRREREREREREEDLKRRMQAQEEQLKRAEKVDLTPPAPPAAENPSLPPLLHTFPPLSVDSASS
jgi:TolA-binding protein